MRSRAKPIVSFTIFLLLLSIHNSNLARSFEASTTTISIYPSTGPASLGQTFTIDVRISNAVDLYGWEFILRWNSSLIEAINVTEGPFLEQGGLTFFTCATNNTAGVILVDCTLLGDIPGVSTNGTLASVQFYAKTAGNGILDLNGTILVNSQEQAISHAEIDGLIVVRYPGDVNNDGIVDVYDLITVGLHFGHTPPDGHVFGSMEYKACFEADLNGDNVIDIYDLIIVAVHYGESNR